MSKSWFDTKQFTSFAKTALNEAQKTLDKALDIQEGENPEVKDKSQAEEDNKDEATSTTSKLTTLASSASAMANSKMWGSFTGSFFDSTQVKPDDQDHPDTPAASVVSIQPSVTLTTVPEAKSTDTIVNESDPENESPAKEPIVTDEKKSDFQSEDLNSSMSSSNTVTIPEASSTSTSFFVEESSSSTVQPSGAAEDGEDPVTETEASENPVTNLIDDALIEAHEHERRSEGSGSSKSYEVVRTEVTSGDELETTTTSSDIEVIASPTSQLSLRTASPSRGRTSGNRSGGNGSKQGHTRTSSEISAVGSEESFSQIEMDRLLRKISELTEVLEVRETKLVEMSKTNLELQEKSVDLQSQVKEAMKINSKLSEASLTSEEFTNRMEEVEKKLQKALAENEQLSSENKKLRQEASSRMSDKELKELLSEKDEIIDDLRREGESLSKQVGKHSEVIKKLRTKEKSTDKEVKKLSSQLEDRKAECDRLKKSLTAKDDIESKQIEAIQNLTKANSKWENEHNKVKSDLEDAEEKVLSLKASLESSYKEIADLKRGLMEKEGEAQEMALSKEMAAKQALQEQLRDLQEQSRKDKESLYLQIDELRNALSAEERSGTRREEQLRREREDLMARLEQSENRHEELSGSVSAATRPLLRQIESLQANLREAQGSSERVERSLSERLQQTTIQLAASQERERNAAEQYMSVAGKVASMESKLNNLVKERAELQAQLETQKSKRTELEDQCTKSVSQADAMKRSFADEIDELKREKEFLEAAFESEKADLATEKRKNLSLADQLKDRDRRIRDIQAELDIVRSTHQQSSFSIRSSPTPSQVSLNGSISEQNYSVHAWPDDMLEMTSSSRGIGMSANLYDTMRPLSSSAAVVESLQAQLKLRDGELVQMQLELANLERSRDNLNAEVTRLTQKVDALSAIEDELAHFKKEYVAVEQKYQTMLTMYGEKVEEAEELRMDLSDVKDMYKTQIQELLQKQ